MNRHPTEVLDVTLSLQGFGSRARVVEHQVMTHPDLFAVNTAVNPMNVAPRAGSGAIIDEGAVKLGLPPFSYQVIRVAVA